MLFAWNSFNSEYKNRAVTSIGLQQTSQSSMYVCSELELSSNIDTSSQQ